MSWKDEYGNQRWTTMTYPSDGGSYAGPKPSEVAFAVMLLCHGKSFSRPFPIWAYDPQNNQLVFSVFLSTFKRLTGA